MGNIKVTEHLSCTWELDGESFFCTHDQVDVGHATQDYVVFGEYYQTEEEVYVCAECHEVLEGDPAADRADLLAEQQLMETLEK